MAYNNLKTRAEVIRTETVDSANSAERIGKLLADLINEAVQPWDPTGEYDPDRFVAFRGYLAEAILPTLPGESPASKPEKWNSYTALDAAQITLGNFNPVSANALAQVLAALPTGTGNGPVLNPATLIEVDEGTRSDVYIAPDTLAAYLAAFLAQNLADTVDLKNIVQDAPNTDRIVAFRNLLNAAKNDTETKALICSIVAGCGGSTIPPPGTSKVYQVARILGLRDATIIPPALPVRARGSVDINSCFLLAAWGINFNDQTQPPILVVMRDGVEMARIVAYKERTDVREVLNAEGESVTLTALGIEYQKPQGPEYNDGLPHTWEVFVLGAQSTAFTYNVPPTLTCGTPVTPTPKVVTELVLLGESFVREGFGLVCTARAVYNDQSTADVTTQLTGVGITGTGVSVAEFLVISAEANQTIGDSRDVVLSASFGGKTATKTIRVIDATAATPVITAISLSPENSLEEGKQLPHFVTATYNDGSNAVLPGSAGLWQLTNGKVTDILDSNGLQTALGDNILGNGRTVQIRFTIGSLQATKNVVVVDKTPGPAPLNRAPELNPGNFIASTNWNEPFTWPIGQYITDPDNDALKFTAEWSTDGGVTYGALPAGLSIDADSGSFGGTYAGAIANGPNALPINIRIKAIDPGGLFLIWQISPLFIGPLDYARIQPYNTIATATSFAVYPDYPADLVAPFKATDGNITGSYWQQNGTGANGQTLTVDLRGTRSVGAFRIVFPTDDFYLENPTLPTPNTIVTLFHLVDYQIQTKNGSGNWTTRVTVTGNNKAIREHTFALVNCDQVRVVVQTAGPDNQARVAALEVYNQLITG